MAARFLLGIFSLGLATLLVANCSGSSFSGGSGAKKSGKDGKDGDNPTDENGKDGDADGEDTGDADAKDADGADSSDGPIIDETTGVKTDPTGLIAENGDDSKHLVPQFGLLANDLKCGMCHLSINGDVVSTAATVPEPHTDARNKAVVNGAWFASQDYAMSSEAVNVRDGVQKNYRGEEMPKDLDKDGKPDFPRADFDNLAGKMTGSVKSNKDSFSKVSSSNVTLIGTDSDPIVLKGEVLVKGDLVISGRYKGIGTIYVTGNAYIPSDLLGQTSPFPYSTDKAKAKQHAKDAVKDRLDALAIASHGSVIVGNFLPITAAGIHSVFERDDTPPEMRSGPLNTNSVLSWYPGGESGISALFKPSALPCGTAAQLNRAIGRIDAYLYAEKAVAGHSIGSSYSINGGVIADFFHIISAAEQCADQNAIHPTHKQPAGHSYVNFDYRMGEGLLLLKQMNKYFKTTTP